jgi:cytochrome c oxidase cbb3-type subunit III
MVNRIGENMDYKKQTTGIALAIVAGTLLLVANGLSAATPGKDEQASAERGERVFASTCSFCHGAQARGGEGGPDLLRSVLVMDDVQGDKIGPVVLNGRPERGMPKFAMTLEQISDIANFLHHSIEAAATVRNNYPSLNIVIGDPNAGESYFNGAGKCNTCHSATGDLKGLGKKYDAVTLQDMIVMPRKGPLQPEHVAVAQTRIVTVTLRSGQSFQGELEHIDDFNVALRDSGGEYYSFMRNGGVPVVVVHDPLKAHSDMLTVYSDTEIHNLTAYLVTLK